MEAPTRFELVMGALQAPALPLGYGAPCGEDYGDSAPPCQLSRTLYGRPLRQDSCEPESPRNRCGARLDTPRGVVYISCGPLGSSSTGGTPGSGPGCWGFESSLPSHFVARSFSG